MKTFHFFKYSIGNNIWCQFGNTRHKRCVGHRSWGRCARPWWRTEVAWWWVWWGNTHGCTSLTFGRGRTMQGVKFKWTFQCSTGHCQTVWMSQWKSQVNSSFEDEIKVLVGFKFQLFRFDVIPIQLPETTRKILSLNLSTILFFRAKHCRI